MPRKEAPSPEELTTLAELLRLKVGRIYKPLTSTVLGLALGVKQQTASKRLIQLERDRLIERTHSGRGVGVRMTEEGLSAITAFYSGLKSALEADLDEMKFSGSVFTGLGEGSYYVSLRGYAKPFRDALGFEPFPGTLNLKLRSPAMVEQRSRLERLPGVDVPGFQDGRRTYGPVKCFKARVGAHLAAVLAIARTHYDDSVLEVISPVNLRKTMKLNDGDEVSVTVLLG